MVKAQKGSKGINNHHQWFNRNFTKLREYFLCAKKTKIMTLFNDFFSPRTVHRHACMWCCWCRTRMRCAFFQAEESNAHASIMVEDCPGREESVQRPYGFGTTWGWVINDRILIFGWTIPSRVEIWHHLYLNYDHFYLKTHTKNTWTPQETWNNNKKYINFPAKHRALYASPKWV